MSIPDSYFTPNTSFSTTTQPFVLYYPDGIHQFVTTLDTATLVQRISVQTGIILGVQIGVTSLLIIILALLTKPEKRLSAIFILNQAALVLLFVRCCMLCSVILGPIFSFYNSTINDYPDAHSAQRLSVTCEVFGFLITAAVELSMLFQVHVVCCTLRSLWRNLIAAGCVLVALCVCSIRFALMVLNANYSIVHIMEVTESQQNEINSMVLLSTIATTSSIIIFSIVFCAKLGHAILHRRRMGMKQFGPMQIIFVMGCQTMVIPGIFAIISNFVLINAQLSSIVLLVVATFLPLSSMWASTNPSNINIAAIRKPVSYKDSSYSSPTEKEYLTTTFNSQGTLVNETEEQARDPRKLGAHAEVQRRDSIDVELAKMGHDIVVDRTFSVRNNSG